jgi:hypothetical protein
LRGPAGPAQEGTVGQQRLGVLNRQIHLIVQGHGRLELSLRRGVVPPQLGQPGMAGARGDPGEAARQPRGGLIEPAQDAFGVTGAATRQVGADAVPRPRRQAWFADPHFADSGLQPGVVAASFRHRAFPQPPVAQCIPQEQQRIPFPAGGGGGLDPLAPQGAVLQLASVQLDVGAAYPSEALDHGGQVGQGKRDVDGLQRLI